MDLRKDYVGQDFISLHDFTGDDIAYILDVADFLKAQKKIGKPIDYLQGKTLGMIFEKSSTRTRVSFETGMYYLGGYALFLSANDLQIGRGEPIKDTARVLSRYLDGLMIRTFGHNIVTELAEYSSIPVINGLTDLLHPCQVLADLQTAREYKGNLKKLKLAYIGDGNNMAHSLMLGGVKMGMEVAVASPVGYEPNKTVVQWAMDDAKMYDGQVTVVNDPFVAAKDADIIYTDVWASMGQESQQAERMGKMASFQVNADLVAVAKHDAIIMHCLPAKRGQEITDEVFESAQSVVFDEAENRLHAQMAVMALTMQDK